MEGIRALSLSRPAGIAAGATRVRSVRCLSTCSGRGQCDWATHSCRCDAFWMQSLFAQLDPDAMPDCSTYIFNIPKLADAPKQFLSNKINIRILEQLNSIVCRYMYNVDEQVKAAVFQSLPFC